jgi:hypothetical protein
VAAIFHSASEVVLAQMVMQKPCIDNAFALSMLTLDETGRPAAIESMAAAFASTFKQV